MTQIDINVFADALHTLKVCKLPPAATILDIGAGSGSFVSRYPYISHITFVDQDNDESGSYTNICKKKYVGNQFRHVTTPAHDLSMFEDDSFDMVVLLQVLEHIALDKIDKTMQEIRRVLKSGGHFVMSTPNRDIRKICGKYLANEHHVQEFSNEELLSLYKRHNFKILQNEGILRIADSKLLMNERCESPEEGYLLWILSTI